jgi:CRP-like cAMP-binding protein
MGSSRRSARTAEAASAEDDRVDPAFHRAILKIAIELRKPSARSYDAVVAETIRSMRLDGQAFRRYLGENGARNMSLLLATARAFGL